MVKLQDDKPWIATKNTEIKCTNYELPGAFACGTTCHTLDDLSFFSVLSGSMVRKRLKKKLLFPSLLRKCTISGHSTQGKF